MSVFLEDIPLLPPPLGQVSNFINPETRAPIVYAISSLCLAIMWPIFLLRLYSKVWIAKAFGFDDGQSQFPGHRSLTDMKEQ